MLSPAARPPTWVTTSQKSLALLGFVLLFWFFLEGGVGGLFCFLFLM